MCPFITHFAQLTYERTLCLTEDITEHDVPLIPHNQQQRLRVPVFIAVTFARHLVLAQVSRGLRKPGVAIGGFELALHEWKESLVEKFERFTHAFCIANCHGCYPPSMHRQLPLLSKIYENRDACSAVVRLSCSTAPLMSDHSTTR